MPNPWFKFYSGDYLLDSKLDELPREAEALLVRMWCVCHRYGSCPADAETLARKTQCPISYVEQHQRSVMPFFEVRDDGRLYSRRLEHERGRSEQNRKNARARFEKIDGELENQNQNQNKTQNQTVAQPFAERIAEQTAEPSTKENQLRVVGSQNQTQPPPPDSDSKIIEIASVYPKVDDPAHLSQELQVAIQQACARDTPEYSTLR